MKEGTFADQCMSRFPRYDTVHSQRQRDKQRLIDLEKNFNDEKQQKQRLELQMKTEKALTKKLQDDLIKYSLAPARFVSRTSSVHWCIRLVSQEWVYRAMSQA